MAFERFSRYLAFRILGITLCAGLFCWAILQSEVTGSLRWGLAVLPLLFSIWQCISLHHYITRVNRKLALFLESIHYSDFSIRFSADNKLGKSFRNLNRQRSEEHTSELQSLMRISYAVFCLKKKQKNNATVKTH